MNPAGYHRRVAINVGAGFIPGMNSETTCLRFVLVLMGGKRRGETSRQLGLVTIYKTGGK